MGYIDNDLVNKILKANNIVDVIGSYLPLIPKGRNQFCVCPFHDDHSPSMSVSEEKQIFRCFVCGESGNSISFLMKYLNINFNEALEILADKCGEHIEKSIKKKENVNNKYYEIYIKANAFFKNNLNSKEGIDAKKYLESRMITKEIIDEFDIGLSLNGGLGNALLKKYSKKELSDLDLINEYNETDSFINRIIFPIKDLDGNIVAFSGRIYKTKEENKYRNSKETIIFKKGNILYNYYLAKDVIRKEKEIILCEGFMDTIRLYSIGIKNSVALMGSNITKEQLEIIKKLKVNVVLNLDQDDAGKLGNYKIGEELLKLGISPKVIIFNKAKDSDELISKYGIEEFKTAYRNKIDFIDYKLEYLKKNKDLNNSEELSKYLSNAVDAINEIDDPILQELKVTELSNKYGINKSVLLNKVIKKEKVIIKKEEKPREMKLNKYLISEIRILYLMLNHDEVIRMYEKDLGYLISKNMNELADAIISYKTKYSSFDYMKFMTYILDNEELNETMKIVMSYGGNEEYSDDELEDYINTVKLYSVKKEIEKLNNKLKNSLDINEKKELLKKIENMKKDVLEW